MDKSLIDELELEDLPEPYRTWAREISIKNLFGLASIVGGKTIYLPTPDSILLVASKKKIINDYYNGKSVKDIAKQHGISCDTVYRYLREKK